MHVDTCSLSLFFLTSTLSGLFSLLLLSVLPSRLSPSLLVEWKSKSNSNWIPGHDDGPEQENSGVRRMSLISSCWVRLQQLFFQIHFRRACSCLKVAWKLNSPKCSEIGNLLKVLCNWKVLSKSHVVIDMLRFRLVCFCLLIFCFWIKILWNQWTCLLEWRSSEFRFMLSPMDSRCFLALSLCLLIISPHLPGASAQISGMKRKKGGLSVAFDPTRVIQLSWRPRAFMYKGFLSSKECDHLIELAKDKLEKSMVADNESGEGVESEIRTSSGMFLEKQQN